jgi:hypothetical protein
MIPLTVQKSEIFFKILLFTFSEFYGNNFFQGGDLARFRSPVGGVTGGALSSLQNWFCAEC